MEMGIAAMGSEGNLNGMGHDENGQTEHGSEWEGRDVIRNGNKRRWIVGGQ